MIKVLSPTHKYRTPYLTVMLSSAFLFVWIWLSLPYALAQSSAPPADSGNTNDSQAQSGIPVDQVLRGLTSNANTLQGLAEFQSSITGSASLGQGQIMPTCRPSDLKCIVVRIKNDSQQVLYINGHQASASTKASATCASSLHQVINSANCQLPPFKKSSLVAVSLLSFGYFSPLYSEILSPHKDLGIAFGRDGERHAVEDNWFGERVLMPGDETSGWLFFDIPPEAKVQSVAIPLIIGRESGTASKLTLLVH